LIERCGLRVRGRGFDTGRKTAEFLRSETLHYLAPHMELIQPNVGDRNNRVSRESRSSPVQPEVEILVSQLGLDMNFLLREIKWALGEERINRVTPRPDQFWEWSRQHDGLMQFWRFANSKLGVALHPDEVRDIWECICMTICTRRRRAFTFQDYLMIAVHSEQKCAFCGKRPPEVYLEIDHILPVSKGGSDVHYNLRFLCQRCNRSRGNRFRWADVWRRLG
jgi:hypothetical protein